MIPSIPGMNTLAPMAIVFGLICVRMGFLIATMPLFNSKILPTRIKAAVVALLSFVAYTGLHQVQLPAQDGISLILAAVGEASIGAAAGLSAGIVFAAVEGAGRLMGIPMGLGFANVVDPLSSTSSVVTSRFLGVVVAMIFLVMDVHHVIFRLLARSFQTLPPGHVIPSQISARTLVESAGSIFRGSVQLAAPVLVVLLGVMVTLGLLARVAPKVNLFVLSFAISIAVGLLSLRAALPEMTVWIRQAVSRIEPMTERVLGGFQ